MKSDTIIIFPAGIMPHENENGAWRTTTYEESDAFGTLGGRDRIEAVALLAKQHPKAYVVIPSHTSRQTVASLAEVYAQELCELGVSSERIIMEESSNSTLAGLRVALQLAKKRGWKYLVGVSSGFHIQRIRAFFEQEHSNVMVEFVASEQVLTSADPGFAERFAAIQKTTAYQTRLAAEARGIAAIKSGTYRPAPIEDKLERPA